MSTRGYLLIQAPPQSGKTSTLQLLLEWARREHPSLDVAYINLSLAGSNFQMDDLLRARLGGTLGEIIKGECSAYACTVCPLGPASLLLVLAKHRIVAVVLVGLPCMQSGRRQMLRWGGMTACILAGKRPVLVCIDAAHFAYHVERTGSADFWNDLKGLEGGPGSPTVAHGIRIVTAASYGPRCNPARTAKPESPTGPPINCKIPNMVVTIFPSPSGASLQLSGAEWSELWENFVEFTGLQLGKPIKDHVGLICSGQVRLAWVALPVVLSRLHQLFAALLLMYFICKAVLYQVITSLARLQ